MSAYPSCLQDGRFFLEFYICHPSDSRIGAIKQHFWLQYHTLSKLQNPLSLTDTHLIWPSAMSEDYVTCHQLCPFWKWLNLTHLDTFIHGPFKFATVHGWKTQDRVSQANWDALKAHLDMSHNALPQFNVPSYSIHIDHGARVTFHNAAISCQLILTTSQAGAAPGAPASP
jgi:hypothetical protein